MPGWAMLRGLVGEGREIHLGEEAGLGQWNDAVRTSGSPGWWHCPARLARCSATSRSAPPTSSTSRPPCVPTSRPTYTAGSDTCWRASWTTPPLSPARCAGRGLQPVRHPRARDGHRHARRRYAGQEDKRYGLLGSSEGDCWRPTAGHLVRRHADVREGPWYNDPPSCPSSCCQFREVATESHTGLAATCRSWGGGRARPGRSGIWRTHGLPRSRAKDPHRLRVNSYRVLLIRGRTALVVFVSPDPRLDPTSRRSGQPARRRWRRPQSSR